MRSLRLVLPDQQQPLTADPGPPAPQAQEPPPEVEEGISTAGNSLWLLTSQGVTILASSGIAILAVRVLSVSAWGHYSSVMALIAIATVFASSGVGTLALREMTTGVDRQATVLGASLATVAASAAVVCVLLIPIAFAIGFTSSTIVLVAIALPLCFLQPALTLMQAAFNARSSLHLAARFQLLQNGLLVVTAVAVLLGGASAAGLIIATVTSAAAALVAALALLKRRLGLRPGVTVSAHTVWRYVRMAWPLATIGIATIIYSQVDVLMLTALRGPRAVAHYTVPYNLVIVTSFIPSAISLAFFPALTAALAKDRDKVPEGFLFVIRLFLFISVPISIFLGIAGSDLLSLIFGARYRSAGTVLVLMAPVPVIAFQIYAFWYPVLAAHEERRFLRIRVGGLALNIAMNAVLIPLYGAPGAAASWVVSELFTALAQVVVVQRRVFRIPSRALLTRPVVAAVIATPVGVLTALASPILGAFVGAVLYVVILLFSGYIGIHELAPVLRAFSVPRFGIPKTNTH